MLVGESIPPGTIDTAQAAFKQGLLGAQGTWMVEFLIRPFFLSIMIMTQSARQRCFRLIVRCFGHLQLLVAEMLTTTQLAKQWFVLRCVILHGIALGFAHVPTFLF